MRAKKNHHQKAQLAAGQPGSHTRLLFILFFWGEVSQYAMTSISLLFSFIIFVHGVPFIALWCDVLRTCPEHGCTVGFSTPLSPHTSQFSVGKKKRLIEKRNDPPR